jgi:hypothetical protein
MSRHHREARTSTESSPSRALLTSCVNPLSVSLYKVGSEAVCPLRCFGRSKAGRQLSARFGRSRSFRPPVSRPFEGPRRVASSPSGGNQASVLDHQHIEVLIIRYDEVKTGKFLKRKYWIAIPCIRLRCRKNAHRSTVSAQRHDRAQAPSNLPSSSFNRAHFQIQDDVSLSLIQRAHPPFLFMDCRTQPPHAAGILTRAYVRAAIRAPAHGDRPAPAGHSSG